MSSESMAECPRRHPAGCEEPRWSRQKEEGQSRLGDAGMLAWHLAGEGPTGGGGA